MGVDLHLHSTASDGSVAPEDLVSLAKRAGLHTIALTDHDTVAGVEAARTVGDRSSVRVIAGCEFSVNVWWGELHLLGFFLPETSGELLDFLERQREHRIQRAREILERLSGLDVHVTLEEVATVAGGSSIGRPHIARVLMRHRIVRSLEEAFDRYLADGKPAFVERSRVDLQEVTDMVKRLGGVTSAAHLKHRGSRDTLVRLRDQGVDAVEVIHPAHDPTTTRTLGHEADRLGLLKSGGSDWHGPDDHRHDRLGTMDVPDAWLVKLEDLHRERAA